MAPLRLEQAKQMLALQQKMNATVNENWLTAGYPFLRAVVVEVGEALEHLGWKWWKKQEPDTAQVIVELIDILHFMLSHELVQNNGDIDAAAGSIVASCAKGMHSIEFDGREHPLTGDPRSLLELLAGLASVRRNELCVLQACLVAMSITWDEAYVQYVSKNVLNIFRQDNGYKGGTYVKDWFGQEDNVHLVEIASTLDPTSPTFGKDLFAQLSIRYRQVIGLES